jgi:hypothetical protein
LIIQAIDVEKRSTVTVLAALLVAKWQFAGLNVDLIDAKRAFTSRGMCVVLSE